MPKKYRDSISGREITLPEAAANPDSSVAESVKQVDMESLAAKLYYAHVGVDAAHFEDELSQEVRDIYRNLARVARDFCLGG